MGLIEAAVGALLAVLAAFALGKRKGRKDAKAENDAAYIDTRKRMDEVPITDESGVLRDWLHERGK